METFLTAITLVILFGTSSATYLEKRAAYHRLVKRQSGPVCGGPYQFSVNVGASSGTTVGTVGQSSASSSGSNMWYTMASSTYSGYFTLNPYTGALTVGPSFNGAAGASTMPLTITVTDIGGGTCTATATITVTGGGGNSNMNYNNNYNTNNNPNYYGGGSGGSGACPYGYYPYNGFCYAQDGFLNNGGNGNTLTSSGCTAGSTVGTVYASGASAYGVSNSNFAISTAGVITLTVDTAAGTYFLLVTGYTSFGTQQTSITVTVSCTVSAAGCGGGSIYGFCFNQTVSTTTYPTLVPVYNATSYNFVATACTAGTTVGTVAASNATSYNMNYGSNYFAIGNTTGIITLLAATTAGQYSATAVANSNGGFSQAVPITVTVVCATG